VRFFDDFLPLLLVVSSARMDDGEFGEMKAGYERYFARNERYAVLTVSPGNFIRSGARERKQVADWLNTPAVVASTRRLCVASAAVLPSAVARGAVTALFWFWTPAFPLRPVPTVAEGLEFCFEALESAKMLLPRPAEAIHLGVVECLRNLENFGPSLGGT
jgi:hypothetical protein